MGCGKGTTEVASKSGCVCDVVRAILDIQNQATQDECSNCTTNCFLEPLGGIVSPANIDTRVFTLSTKNGMPFFATFSPTEEFDDVCISIYFRVEDIFDDCCATLRVLIPLEEDGDPVNLINDQDTGINLREVCNVAKFAKSDNCITVDLDCFCAVQCIADVNLNICN